ncbi:hypothetical protein EVB67_039 [Rhizobium phage RHph_TM3_3_14B]|nr:hypothetical protein EVB67_039 [Rhizobium phage RHph_TM3_3_14B]
MGKFKKGDRVRLIENRHGLLAGDVGTLQEDDDGAPFVKWDKTGIAKATASRKLELVEQPWQPKVGDRVRMKHDVDGHKAECDAEIVYDDGTTNQPLAIKFDKRHHFGHTAGGKTPDGFGYWVGAGDIEPLPAAFTIKAGKFYKTRDGRKVGPVTEEGYMDVYPFRVPGGPYGKVYIRKDGTANLGMSEKESPLWDLIAEWVDEPAIVVAASNDAAPTGPKFKVGDVVKRSGNFAPPHHRLRITEVINDDDYTAEWLVGGPGSTHNWRAYEFELITPPAIVALIENGQPKPATRPFVHATEEAAKREADRLAGVHKGQQFGVYVLTTTSQEAAPVYKHEWQRLAAKGEKIAAIKELRDHACLTLKGAKDAVEHWLATAA